MIDTSRQALIEKLAELWDLSPEVRLGQFLANVGMLVEDQLDRSLWDVEDEELRDVLESHGRDLARRLEPEVR